MQVDVAFITVNYNTCGLVKELVSFFNSVLLPFSFRLVVVDNASSDGSHEYLSGISMPELIYVQTNENLGYGRGMNRGLSMVDSRYACIMNTDLILNQEALVALWEFFQADPQAGVATPLIRGADGRQQGFIFHPGILSLYSSFICKIRSKRWKRRVEQSNAPVLVPGVLGAFFMIRRSLFGNTLFDEDFFFYYEDTELAHRYWQAGMKCCVLPEVSIVHLGGQSTSASGGRLFQISRRLYVLKVYGEHHALLVNGFDRLRLYGKCLKYHFLNLICPTEKIRSKSEFYRRLLQHD